MKRFKSENYIRMEHIPDTIYYVLKGVYYDK